MLEDPHDAELNSLGQVGQAALSEAYRQVGLEAPVRGLFSQIEVEFEVTGRITFETCIKEASPPVDGSGPQVIINARSDADLPALIGPRIEEMKSSMSAAFQKDLAAVFPSGYRDQRVSDEIIRIEKDCGPCRGRGDETCGSCNGHGALICGRCNGHAQLQCGRCGGRRIEACLNCNGNARLWTGSEWVNCRRCFGTGWDSGCSGCRSTGLIRCVQCSEGSLPCRKCGSTGKVTCKTCSGEKRKTHLKSPSVTLSTKPDIGYVSGETDAWDFLMEKVIGGVSKNPAQLNQVSWSEVSIDQEGSYRLSGAFRAVRASAPDGEFPITVLCAGDPRDISLISGDFSKAALDAIGSLDLSRPESIKRVRDTRVLRNLLQIAVEPIFYESKYTRDEVASFIPSYGTRALPLMREKVSAFLRKRRRPVFVLTALVAAACGLAPILSATRLPGMGFTGQLGLSLLGATALCGMAYLTQRARTARAYKGLPHALLNESELRRVSRRSGLRMAALGASLYLLVLIGGLAALPGSYLSAPALRPNAEPAPELFVDTHRLLLDHIRAPAQDLLGQNPR